MKRVILKYIGCFVALIALFTGLMTAVYAIPNEAIEWHEEYSKVVLDIEESWESLGNLFGGHGQPGMLDNTTDRVMMEAAMVQHPERNAFLNAMDINGYARYWHGYQVFLRPLLTLYQYHQIRYLNLFIFFGTFILVLFEIRAKLGRGYSAAFFMAVTCSYLTTIPSSMQFMSVYMTAFAASLIVLKGYPFQKRESVGLLFMVVGMVTSFLDLLTAPLVTLGLPILLDMALDAKENERRCICNAFAASLSWGAGYALCWASKWLLAYVALGKGVMSSVSGHAEHWAAGQLTFANRLEAVKINFEKFFLQHGLRTMIFPLALFAVLLVLAIAFYGGNRKKIACSAGMFCTALYPYIWYFVMAEHSRLHQWFTFRNQAMTLLAVYFAVANLVDWNRVKKAKS